MSDSKGAINPINLDTDLDDIADLPGFSALPTGAFLIRLEDGIIEKEINKHPALEVKMTILAVEELLPDNLDEGENPPKEGDTATQMYTLDNEYGIGNFKKDWGVPIRLSLGAEKLSVRATMEASKGMEFLIVVKRRHGRKGTDQEDKNFMSFTKVSVV